MSIRAFLIFGMLCQWACSPINHASNGGSTFDSLKQKDGGKPMAKTDSLPAPDSLHAEPQDPQYAVQGNKAFKIKNKEGHTFFCYLAEPKSVQLFWKNSKDSIYDNFFAYKAEVEKQGKKLVFASNGGMYMPDQSPQGLYVEKGKTLQPLDTEQNKHGNFYMQPNGVFLITKEDSAFVTTTKKYPQFADRTQSATQSGPMLVIDGKINDKFDPASKNLHIRNGVGVAPDGRVLLVISADRVRFYELADIFLQHGCQQALYLDGAISQTYLPQLGLKENGGGFGVMIGVVKQ